MGFYTDIFFKYVDKKVETLNLLTEVRHDLSASQAQKKFIFINDCTGLDLDPTLIKKWLSPSNNMFRILFKWVSL